MVLDENSCFVLHTIENITPTCCPWNQIGIQLLKLSALLSVWPSIFQSIWLPTFLTLNLLVFPSVSLTHLLVVCLASCLLSLFVCLPVTILFVCLSFCLSTELHSAFLYVCFSVYPSTFLSFKDPFLNKTVLILVNSPLYAIYIFFIHPPKSTQS